MRYNPSTHYIQIQDNGVWYDYKYFNPTEPVALVPVMTSNTTPYGEAIATTQNTNAQVYKLFDGDDSTKWYGANGVQASGQSVGYNFVSPVCVTRVYMYTQDNSSAGYGFAISKFKIQGSNDGTTYTDLSGEITTTSAKAYYSIDNGDKYLYYRLYIIATGYPQDIAQACDTYALQFYGYE